MRNHICVGQFCGLRLLIGAAIAVPVETAAANPCEESARVYLDATALQYLDIDDSFQAFFGSSHHAIRFTFAAGTTPENVIVAINSFSAAHGLHASFAAENTDRIQITSLVNGYESHAVITQNCTESDPLLFTQPIGGTATYHVEDFGTTFQPADFDCNHTIDVSDLLLLLDQWGDCPESDDCHADLTDGGTVDVFDLLLLLTNWG